MNTLLGIGIYREEDYSEILKLSEDKEEMDETWEDWKKSKEKAQKGFQEMGFKTVDILVEPRELVIYCGERGLKINGKSRAEFITQKVRQLD